MTVDEYEILAGVTVASSRRRLTEASLDRSQRILEDMLGYTLDPDLTDENLYNELGKANDLGCVCSNIDLDNLAAPDEVEGAYRLFPYNPKDKFLQIDPATTIYAVKLVYVVGGVTGDNGVTIRTFENDEYRVDYGRDGWTKYLEIDQCPCRDICWGERNVQLAVDADWQWAFDMPEALQFIWADMVQSYANPKSDLKSESIGQHSYTRFDNTKPEDEPRNIATIKRYAGPHGSVSRMPV